MNVLTSSEILKNLKDHNAWTHEETKRFWDAFLDLIYKGLKKDKKVSLANFGTFRTYHKNARIARNPRTCAPALAQERYVVQFKPAKKFKMKIRGH